MKVKRSGSAFTVWGRRFLIGLLWAVIWQTAYLIVGRDIYFPSPLSVAAAFFRILAARESWLIIGWSLYRTVFAITVSVVLGAALGLAGGLSRRFHAAVNPLMVILKSTPVVSVIIIAIIWFRSSDVPIFSGVLMCLPLVFNAAVAGVRGTDPGLAEMCAFYGVNRADRLRRLYFPSALPYINASVVSVIGVCWKAVAAAEALSMPRLSIGAQLFFAKTGLDPAMLFAWTIIIITFSFIFETAYARISGYDSAAGHQ
jgi:NitT/TauT family transport system permease protein